jgi:Nucleotidyl transferase AbiEii toxin, Type IV TA system
MNHSHAQSFLALSAQRKKLAYDQASGGQAGQSVIIEKDFWVSWLLALLFSQPELAPHLVFKGGTSLSKVFGVIDRFSEDIDLCLVPEFVGASAQGFDALTSRSWARYDIAVPGSFRLAPAPERMAALANDYTIMRPMFINEPPPFESVVSILRQAEAVLNGHKVQFIQ